MTWLLGLTTGAIQGYLAGGWMFLSAFCGLLPESQGQNLALTVFYGLHSLNSGHIGAIFAQLSCMCCIRSDLDCHACAKFGLQLRPPLLAERIQRESVIARIEVAILASPQIAKQR